MRVYVAGPYTTPDVDGNVRRAIDVADQLLVAGHAPFVPHLNHHWHAIHPHDYETWMQWCLAWVRQCDALIRLPGHSPGADREVTLARALAMPIYPNTDAFLEAYQ